MGKKNYFDEMKKRKIGDGFFEHIFRLLFFAVLLTIEGMFKKLNELRFRFANFMSGRGFSHIYSRYTEYKNSVHHLIEQPFYRGRIRKHLIEIKDRIFSDRDKKLIFGFRESTQTIIIKSKSAFSKFRGYTIRVGRKYFKPSPIFNVSKNYSASFFTFFLKKDTQGKISRSMKQNREYMKDLTSRYNKFMNDAFTKFYTNDFKARVAEEAVKMKTVQNNLGKLLKSIDKVKKKQLKSAIEQSIS
jgi:hypothetical protein